MSRRVTARSLALAFALSLLIALLLGSLGVSQTCTDYEPRFRWVGAQAVSGMARGIAVEGDLFAILEGADGFELYQLPTDESPVWQASVAAIDSTLEAVFRSSYLFVADGSRVIAYDISTLSAPSAVDTLVLPSEVAALTQTDVALIACCGESGLILIDVTTPDDMQVAATLPLGGAGARDAAAYHDELVVGGADTLYTVWCATPSAPVIVGRIALPGRARRVTRSDWIACAVGDSIGVAVVDLADFANPTAIIWTSLGTPNQMLLSGGVLLSTTFSGTLRYHQILGPQATPLNYGFSPLPLRTLTGPAAPGQGLALLGDLLLIASGGGGGQGFIHRSAVPVVPIAPTYNWNVATPDFAICRDVAVFARGETDAAGILDLTDPRNPALIASTLPAAAAIAGRDSLAYLISADGTLTIHDLSVPTSPLPLSSTPLGVTPVRCALSGDWLFVGVESTGLLPVDVTDPSAPVPAPVYPTLGEAHDLAVVAGVAYIVDGSNRLQTIDVEEPASPGALGWVTTPGTAQGVAVSGAMAYVADGPAGVTAVDVSDPAHPVVVGSMSVAEAATAIAAAGGILYFGDAGVGLLLADARNPQDLNIDGHLFLLTPPLVRVRVVDDYLYMLSPTGRFSISRRSCDALTPVFLTTFTTVLEGGAAVVRWETTADAEFRLTARAGGSEWDVPWTRRTDLRFEARDEAAVRCTGVAVEYTLRSRENDGAWVVLANRRLHIPAARTTLHEPYPNPFNPRVTVAFTLDRAQVARLTVHDARGRLVAELANGMIPAGLTEVTWEGRDGRGRAVAADAYFVRFETEDTRETQRVTLVR